VKIIIIIIIDLFILTANEFLSGGCGTTITHKITHQAQTKHSTQNYTNNRGNTHTTHIEFNANTIAITII
jgi:uncharacterized protein YceK